MMGLCFLIHHRLSTNGFSSGLATWHPCPQCPHSHKAALFFFFLKISFVFLFFFFVFLILYFIYLFMTVLGLLVFV